MKPGMLVHIYNTSTEAGGLQVQGQPGLHSEFKARLAYIVRPCLKKKEKIIRQMTRYKKFTVKSRS
jgi:hypothetical protein